MSGLTAAEIVEGVRRRDARLVARAMTLAESSNADDRALLDAALAQLGSGDGAWRIGITGPPGAGKSSLIDVLGVALLRSEVDSLAVLTVDPSSAVRGGSVLGDRIRMTQLSSTTSAFVRSTPSGTSLNGLATSTEMHLQLCDAAGFDLVIVETVGGGQLDGGVADLVDLLVMVIPPGGGDAIQMLKRGIGERADVVVVSKHDGALSEAAELAAATQQGGGAPVIVTSSVSGEGIDALAAQLCRLRDGALEDEFRGRRRPS